MHYPLLDPEKKSTLITYTRSNTTQIDIIRENLYENLLQCEYQWEDNPLNIIVQAMPEYLECSVGYSPTLRHDLLYIIVSWIHLRVYS